MMKKIFCTILVFMVVKISIAQQPIEILKNALQKIDQTNSFSYIMFRKSKISMMRDTTYTTGKCKFVRDVNDTLMGMKIRIEDFKGTLDLYDGIQYINSRTTDHTAFIWNASKFNFFAFQLLNNPLAYHIIFKKKNMVSEMINDSVGVIVLKQDSIINEEECYRIQYSSIKKSKGDKTEVEIDLQVFIRKIDFFPIGYIQNLQGNFNSNYHNFESVFLEELACNTEIDKTLFSLNAVPAGYTYKQQAQMAIKNYLIPSELVPDLKVNSLTRDSAFNKQNAKIILLAFIDADNCNPCERAIQVINILYNKYHRKGFGALVLSNHRPNFITDYEFIKTQDKTIPSFYNAEAIRNENKISIYPTFYLIDKDQKTLYQSEGYNETLKQDLENIIQETLKK